MLLRRAIAFGLLLAVLLAPAMGLALCRVPGAAPSGNCPLCASHAAMQRNMHPGHAKSPAQSPCCQRRAPLSARAEASAITVSPVHLGLLPAVTTRGHSAVLPALRAQQTLSPPSPAPPLALLCTLRI